ncbi:MAG: zinc metallopeptidase [Chloroflexi bacterium]|nr:zinc metallopeptidase [Chloroflexota bacterium]
MYISPTYILFALPALLLGLYAQFRVRSAYTRYLKVRNRSNVTGGNAALSLLRAGSLETIKLVEVPGELTDHYDPRHKSLALSQEVARTPSVAALGIVAHEIGHALQDREGYLPMRLRGGLVPVVQIGSWLGPILFIAGLLLSLGGLAQVGLLLFSGTLVFSLITLPVEFNASARAIAMLQANGLIVSDEEEKGVRAVLSAAALTYVAAAVQSLANILYYASLLSGSRRR